MSASTSVRQPATKFIFVTLVLAVVGFSLLIPVLPNLIVEFSGGSMASGSGEYGWIMSIYALMQFISSPILGALSDRFGRRPIILIATAGSAVDYLIMANAPTLTWFFIARMIAGTTAGVLSTANAYIADVTPAEKRAQGFGLVGAAFGIGFVIGPVVGGFLGNYSLRLPFWFAAGCSALNALYGFFVLPESLKPENRRKFSWKRANPIGALLALKRFPAVLGLVESYFLAALATALLQSTWALYTKFRYTWSPLQVGLSLMSVGVASGLVQATVVKKLVPKIGDTRTVIIGFCISMLAYVGYGLAPYGWVLCAVICVGAFAGIAQPALQAYITKHVSSDEQGTVQGVFGGLTSLANIPGPFIASHSFGWAIAPHDVHMPHVFSFLDSSINWFLWHLLPRHPGVAFFEGTLLYVGALLLVVRAFGRNYGVPAAAPESPVSAA